jgi:transposase
MATSRCHGNYVHCVIFIMFLSEAARGARPADLRVACVCIRQPWPYRTTHYAMPSSHNGLDSLLEMYIIQLTSMRRSETGQPRSPGKVKADTLRRQGALHPHPDAVRDEAFRRDEFFDPRDLVQVRYEMLRRHQIDGDAVTEVAVAFGVSRQAYYITEAAFTEKGIIGLLPRRRGPQRAHKCTDEILDFVEQWRADTYPEEEVSEAVQKRFGVSIHPRSLTRALARRKKKQR